MRQKNISEVDKKIKTSWKLGRRAKKDTQKEIPIKKTKVQEQKQLKLIRELMG
jgi:hypothetical protein